MEGVREISLVNELAHPLTCLLLYIFKIHLSDQGSLFIAKFSKKEEENNQKKKQKKCCSIAHGGIVAQGPSICSIGRVGGVL